MSALKEILMNKYILLPISMWVLVQCFKVIAELIKSRDLNLRRIIGAGGMPSSHSACVVTLTTVIGKNIGFSSATFAIAFVFTIIVMYDAIGVRYEAGRHAKILNEMKIQKKEGKKLIEQLGHRPHEVAVGALLGMIYGYLLG